MVLKFAAISILIAIPNVLSAQATAVDKLDQKYLNWYNLDHGNGDVLGTQVDKAYKELLQSRPVKKTIIVAVIDGGVDIYHDDLHGKIWVNEDEIPNNNVDDDQNGYIDDIHGWNFIGNAKGENIMYENMEYTRIYKSGVPTESYERAKEMYEKELSKRLTEKENIRKFEEAYNNAKSVIKRNTKIDVHALQDLDAISSNAPSEVLRAKEFLSARYKGGFTEHMLSELKKNNLDYLDKFLNTKFEARGIINDDPTNINDKNYGNADVKGPRSNHGTSVAGIIAAVRNNNIGTNGIASEVKIMAIRSTPRGDERDKDVALAILYAVNNGADIINMSFGKAFSPEKKFVDDAVRLAEQKNVLIVHASGNNGKDIDTAENYPSDQYLDKTEATNWMNVGASGMMMGDEAVAIFSNYGQHHVDIFAPGSNIISLDSSNTYSMNDGTSLAAPVVSGIAALLLSYHPELTPKDVIQILMESSHKMGKLKVLMPDLISKERSKVKFSTLSKSGGIVDVYEAMKMADGLGTSSSK